MPPCLVECTVTCRLELLNEHGLYVSEQIVNGRAWLENQG